MDLQENPVSVGERSHLSPSTIYQHPVIDPFQPHRDPTCIGLKHGKTLSTVQTTIQRSIFKYDIRPSVKFD